MNWKARRKRRLLKYEQQKRLFPQPVVHNVISKYLEDEMKKIVREYNLPGDQLMNP